MDDFGSIQSDVSSALVSSTRTIAQLSSEDLTFHRSLDSSLAASIDRQNARLLNLTSRLLSAATANTEAARTPSLKDVDAIDANWRTVVDVVDGLLERADTALDEFTGAVKRLSPGALEQASRAKSQSRPSRTTSSYEIKKPQLLFQHVPTNKEQRPFKPLLQGKPHAITPLDSDPSRVGCKGALMYPHPYQVEIERYRYPTSVYTRADPIPYKPFDSTVATFVDTEGAVEDMLQELKTAKEIAIDLEHHDQRSYIGIVCLMQISTRDKDWIVDTLKPWRRKLQCLNEVFANPSIVKVLHGAYMDVVWLQRDLGLYLVGLFDTHYASRTLGYSGGSLAFLLKYFVNIDAQKQYQMADWRVRPLPQELVDYARSDTHYLLYIFDCMRNELIQRSEFALPDHQGDKLWDVLQKSNDTALQRYEIPIYDPELGQGPNGWYRMLHRTSARFSKEQFAVFRAVHKWRDQVARDQDDSTHWVMPNHQVFSIAREMPTERTALLSLAKPVSQTLRLRADELASVIKAAKHDSTDAPEMVDILNRVEPRTLKAGLSKQATNPSMATSVTKTDPTPTRDAMSSNLPIRSWSSRFWGTTLEDSVHSSRSTKTNPGLSLSIPLPPLTAKVFVDKPDVEDSAAPPPLQTTTSEQEHIPNGSQDESFTLKQLSQKRKRQSSQFSSEVDSMAAQSDEVVIPDDAEDRQQEKAAKRRARKAEKRAMKLANSASETTHSSDSTHQEAPFDYASAPSILNPPRETKDEMRARKKKEINPYAKALDTPKGLPRAQKERGGRSMTFK